MERNNRETLISVLIPVYNDEKYISLCFDSILSQTYTNLDILIIDDGSSDGSACICDNYAEKDKRIRVIHKKNEGQAVARNLAINLANGEYLIFVDSDDVITPSYVEALYDLIKKYDCKIAVSCLKTFKDGEEPIIDDSKYVEECFTPLHAVELMNYQEKFDTWPVCKLYHKSIFASGLRYPIGLIFEDFALTYLLLLESDKVAYCNRVDYYYRLRPNSTEGVAFDNYKMAGAMNVINSFNVHENILEPIEKSCKCRMVSFAYHLLLKMHDDDERRHVFEKIIKMNRFTVLFDKKARVKARLACFVSLFGFKIVKVLFSFIDRRK